MLRLNFILLASAIFAFCDSLAILSKINKKCATSEDECVKSLYKSLIQEASDNGIPELNVPKVDPLMVKDMEMVALGILNITVKEGEVTGLKSCEPTYTKTDLAAQRHTINLSCNHIAVECNYKIESTPTLLGLIGGINVHGEGQGGTVFEKVTLSFDFGFELKKLDDGEIYLQIKHDDIIDSYEVTGQAVIHADNLMVGKQEISAVVVNIFNENWDFLTNSVGKTFIDKAADLLIDYTQTVLNKIPLKELFTDDLSSYVKS